MAKDATCPVCQREAETINHVFQCMQARQLYKNLEEKLKLFMENKAPMNQCKKQYCMEGMDNAKTISME
jgi:hypothetical protein